MEEILHSISHALIHSLKELLFTAPLLFLAYLLMEFVEHKASEKMENTVSKIGKFSPFVGTGLGLIPQCGFSASCSNLYATGLITEGTLIAVFLATSDEAIPLLLAKPEVTADIWKFILVKNQETKNLLSELSGFQPHVKTANAVICAIADKNAWKKEEFYQFLHHSFLFFSNEQQVFFLYYS